MKIAIIGSMVFVEEMLRTKGQLEALGHQVMLSKFAFDYIHLPKDTIERQTIHNKHNNDGLKELCHSLNQIDAVLVLNYDKKDVRNYIGGNTFLEMGYAFILGKKIFLLHPIPDMLYTSEIVAMKPVIINDDYSKII